MIRHFYLIVLLFFYSSYLWSQARLIINDDAYLVIKNGGSLVIENGNDNAILTMGSGGNIISEGEQNKIHWEIDENLGIYTLPFTTTPSVQGGNSTKIPFSMEITNQGSGSGSYTFSTYETATDENTPFPTGVTNMTNAQGQDGSLTAVDRFWIIKPSGYTAAPDVTMTFSYDDASNENGGSNIITESALQAQRWNTTLSSWEGIFFGTVDNNANTVSSVEVLGSDFFSVWMLSENPIVLPVELIDFRGVCEENTVVLKWQTAFEINNDYFQIEKSIDGLNYVVLSTMEGSTTPEDRTEYIFKYTDTNGEITTYYRLRQVDLDGQFSISPSISVASCANEVFLDLFPNPSHGIINIQTNGTITKSIQVFDAVGQLVHTANKTERNLQLEHLKTGSYYMKVRFKHDVITKRFEIVQF